MKCFAMTYEEAKTLVSDTPFYASTSEEFEAALDIISAAENPMFANLTDLVSDIKIFSISNNGKG